jgi:hypothetical protein
MDQKKPFFARFLEGQEPAKVKSGVKAGRGVVSNATTKYPSDSDEGWPF